jgi:hypothetical protein
MQDTGTLFGFRAKSPGTGGAQIEVDIGLMRFEHYSNPVSTNQLYVGPFSKHVDATLSLINQKAEEDYSTYPTSVNINTNGSSFSTRP